MKLKKADARELERLESLSTTARKYAESVITEAGASTDNDRMTALAGLLAEAFKSGYYEALNRVTPPKPTKT